MKTAGKSNSVNNYFIVFVCMIIQAIPYGIVQNIQPLFVPYVVNAFNFSLGSFSLIFTFGAIAAAIASPLLGKFYGKVNIKILFIIGTILSSLGVLGFGYAQNLPQFYVLSAISQIGSIIFSGLGVPFLINSWFPKKGRGKALGLAFSGGSIGNIFLQQIVSNMLANKGYSWTYIFFGLVSLVVSIALLFMVRSPRQDEFEILNNQVDDSKVDASKNAFEGLGFKGTVKSGLFWIFTVGYAIIAIAISAITTQYATYFTNALHFDAGTIGTIGSIFAICCLIGNTSGGALFDKIGTAKTMLIGFILMLLGILSMLFASSTPILGFIFAITFGLNVYTYTVAPGFMSKDVFGKKDTTVILGIISLMFALGFAFGSAIFGVIVDNFGFSIGWFSMIGCAVVGFALLLFSVKAMERQRVKNA